MSYCLRCFEEFHGLHGADHFGDQLFVREVLQADALGQAGSDASAAAFTQGFVDVGLAFVFQVCNRLVGTGSDALLTAGAGRLVCLCLPGM